MTYDDATIAHRSISWFDGKYFDGHTIKVQMPSADQKRIFLELQLSNKKRKIEGIENQQMKGDRICKICSSNHIGVVFFPCGHLISCVNCSPKLKDCPFCRQFIKGKIKTFS